MIGFPQITQILSGYGRENHWGTEKFFMVYADDADKLPVAGVYLRHLCILDRASLLTTPSAYRICRIERLVFARRRSQQLQFPGKGHTACAAMFE
jgi:hypothetical protein